MFRIERVFDHVQYMDLFQIYCLQLCFNLLITLIVVDIHKEMKNYPDRFNGICNFNILLSFFLHNLI